MAGLQKLFRCVGKAVCAQGMRGLMGLIPLGEVAYDVAHDVLEMYRKEGDRDALKASLEVAARVGRAEVVAEARAVAREAAQGQPPEIELRLVEYLSQIPSLVRQSFRRPSDSQGHTAPPALSFVKAEELLGVLPARFPRFHVGDSPPGVGDWDLVELLGCGGFGEVWKAKHRYFDGIAPVALKFCLDPEAKDRLLKYEASVLNQVMRHGRHPGVVPLLDASLGSDPPCLKYEYIEGGDLAGLAKDWAHLTPAARWRDATALLRDLAHIVGGMHRLSPPIVHRDLKPANVLVQRQGENWTLRVTDFGIGAVAASEALRAQRQGSVTRGGILATSLRGSHTPLYASPQQVRGEPPDVRDDVHAMGIIWYQLLMGDLVSGTPTGLWTEELEEMGLGRELIRLLGACVSPKPERRPADAQALAEGLGNLLEGPDSPKPVLGPPPSPVPERLPDKVQELIRAMEATPFLWLLDLTNKGIGDEGLQAIAGHPSLANRSTLILSGNGITDKGLQALVESPKAVNISKLVLWDNHITDSGVKVLAESPNLGSLSSLDLGRNRIGDAGAVALATSAYMTNLNALILVSNHIGDEGALALAQSPYLENLAELKPLNNHITATGADALRARYGKRVRIY